MVKVETKDTLGQQESLAFLVKQEGLVQQDLQEKSEKMDYL